MIRTRMLFLCGVLVCGAALQAADAPRLHQKITAAPANKWAEIQSDDFGGRFASAPAFVPTVNGLVWWGTRVHGHKMRSHETEHFDLATLEWADALPPGKDAWKGNHRRWPGWNMAGPATFYTRDGVKLPRPSFAYNQLAWDAHNKRLVYYVGGVTFTYDPAMHRHTELKVKTGPPLGLKGGAMCAVPDAKKIVLFGGFGCENPEGRPRAWYFDCETDRWVRPKFGTGAINGLREKLSDLGKRARRLRRAAQDRAPRWPLNIMANPAEGFIADVNKLAAELDRALSVKPALVPNHLVVMMKKGTDLAASALAALRTAAAKLKERSFADGVAALEKAEDNLTYYAVDALRVEPPPRCNAPLVYDSKNKRVVLFGGYHLDYDHADTWVLDVAKNRWERRTPKVSPPAQSVHGMSYLEKSGLVFLAGSQGNWTYDVAKNVWKPVPGKTPRSHGFSITSVPGTDVAIGCAAWSWNHSRKTYAYRLDPATAAAKHKQFATTSRRGPAPKTQRYSRKWFDDVPPADPARFGATLEAIPDNTWTTINVPRRLNARTWSSCTFDARRREIIYWGGGHSGNVNSNVDHFSMLTGRWSTNYDPMWKPWPYGRKAASPNGRTYQNEPWTMHARKTYAWDPVSGMVAMAHVGGGGYYRLRDGRSGRYTWIYNPTWGEWVDRIDTPFRCGYHGAAVSTPRGVMLLDGGQVWLLDVRGRRWSKYGPPARLPAGEYYSTVHDPKRDRLIYLAEQRNKGPEMHLFDIGAKKWSKASPRGQGCYSRDAAYVPGQDAVFAHAGSGTFKVYLCNENRWRGAPAIKGARRGISEQALTIDPATGLILFIDARQFCGPFDLMAFRLNLATLKE